jgi:hypothetical protein
LGRRRREELSHARDRETIVAMDYEKEPDVVKRTIAGEAFLIPIKNRLADMQNVFVLHGSAEFIWDQLDGIRKLDDVLADVVSEFDVEQVEAETDMKALVTDLSDAGLVRQVG